MWYTNNIQIILHYRTIIHYQIIESVQSYNNYFKSYKYNNMWLISKI